MATPEYPFSYPGPTPGGIPTNGPYASAAQIVDFLQRLWPQFTANLLPQYVIDATTELIENRTQVWEVFSGALLVNGRDENYIVCPMVPIRQLLQVNIIELDNSVTNLIIGGPQNEIKFDPDSGVIRRINYKKAVIDINTLDEDPIFDDGLKNIQLIGTFGRGPYNILIPLQCLLALQMLRNVYPKYFGNIESEKIGDYMYKINFMERTQNIKNQVLTLDGYINMLFDTLPKDYNENVMAI